mgnify:CR=1 FL=1
MRALIQRVRKASVEINGSIVGQIGPGLLILFAVTHSDTEEDAVWLADKLANLRIFCDDAGKMNRSLLDNNGEALVVSQFTLYGDCKKGRRPGFSEAALPDHAIPLYEKFVELLSLRLGKKIPTGEFGADMLVSLENDGPVTFMVDTK